MRWHQEEVDYLNLFLIAAIKVARALFRQLDFGEVHFDFSWLTWFVVSLPKHLLSCITKQHEFLALVVRQVAGATTHFVPSSMIPAVQELKKIFMLRVL